MTYRSLLPEATVAEIVAAYHPGGRTMDAISAEYGTSKATIHRLVVAAGVPRRPTGAVRGSRQRPRKGRRGAALQEASP